MTLITALKETSPNLSPASKFTSACGILYMALGALLLLRPSSVQILLFDPDFVGNESVLMRIIGMTVAVIGIFYLFGGRSGGRQVVAASILDRLILVPLVLLPAAANGVFPHTFLLFAVLDPLLALIAWRLLSRGSGEIEKP